MIVLWRIYRVVKRIVPEPCMVLIKRVFKKFLMSGKIALNIDIAGCNLKCAMCARGGIWGLENSKKGMMDLELFKKIINKVSAEKAKLGLLLFGNWGESLLNPLFPEMVRYAKSKLSPVLVSVNTNLTYLKDPISIIESGLDMMCVSISGMSQEVYSKNHIGGDINTVLGNLRRIVLLKKQLNSPLCLKMIFHDYLYNKADADLAKRFCRNNGIEFVLNRCFIPSVEANKKFHEEKDKFEKFCGQFIDLDKERRLMGTLRDYRKCRILNNIIAIDFDAQLYRCCGVYEEKYFLGSFFDFKIREIKKIKSKICESCAKIPISFR